MSASTEQRGASSPDVVRLLGFHWVLRHAGADEAARLRDVLGTPPQDALAALSAEQQSRVAHVATRRLAFEMLYALDATRERAPEAFIDQYLASVPDLGPFGATRAKELALGAWQARERADADFQRLAPEWPAHRQPAVDRAILRLAHFEVTSGASPPRIAINEGVELARAFSGERSPAFVNALLDKIAQPILAAQDAGTPRTGTS